MRQTTVFLNDYVEKRRTGLTFAEDDFIMVEARWESEEQQLVALQNIDVFAGLTRYSQLSRAIRPIPVIPRPRSPISSS
jgi:hypothetical protein